MFAIILVQALDPHMPVVNGQTSQQGEGAVSVVVKLLTFDLARVHPLCRRGSFQNLEAGLLIYRQDNFAALPQTLDSLVIPENFEGPFDRFVIPDGRLPPTKTMRLQIGFAQDVTHCREMDVVYIFLLHRGLRQTAIRPMGHLPTDRGGFAASQSFNPLAFASGKKHADGQNAARRIKRLADRSSDNVRRRAR